MKQYDLHILDLQSDDIDNIFTITIYGKTLDNQNIVCHVKDFKPYFYVKIPDTWNKNTFETNIIKELETIFNISEEEATEEYEQWYQLSNGGKVFQRGESGIEGIDTRTVFE